MMREMGEKMKKVDDMEKTMKNLICEDCIGKNMGCDICKKTKCLICGSNKCENCPRNLCKKCTSKCQKCLKVTCLKCIQKCEKCNAEICINCKPEFKKCLGCHKQMCKKCIAEKSVNCEICQKICCTECSKNACVDCVKCKKSICMACAELKTTKKCNECKKILCGKCEVEEFKLCKKCKEIKYCDKCIKKVKKCKNCGNVFGKSWKSLESIMKGKEIISNISVAYPNTHDGGVVMDKNGFIWSIHGESGYGAIIYKLNPKTNTKESYKLPFPTHGSYPIYDNDEFIYLNHCNSASKMQSARINITTGNIENLPDSPSGFNTYTNGVFINEMLYRQNSKNNLMCYDVKNKTWKDNIFSIGCKANMLIDPRNENNIFFILNKGEVKLYSIDKNTFIQTFTNGGYNYSLDQNCSCEIIQDSEDYDNCFIFITADYSAHVSRVLNIKKNQWTVLNWAHDTGSGNFLIFDGEKMWSSVNQEQYWRQIIFDN